MRVLEDAWSSRESLGPSVVTIGNFDGIHRGQQRVLDTVAQRARALEAQATVVTFEPHPLSVLRPERPPQRITTEAQKRELIRRRGIDLLVNVRFDPEFASTSARGFVDTLLVDRLGAREVFVGSAFGFGRRREGNLELLQRLGEGLGFTATGIEEIVDEGGVVSSTRIRQAVRAGEVAQAADLLGRAWALTGRVVHGEGRGRQHGWPTLNLEPDHDLLPADGVYASQVWIPARRKVYGAVTNIGRRPTFPGDDRRIVEAHVFDFGRDAYGDAVELSFAERLRGERRFPSPALLFEQIGRDAAAAREYLARENCCRLVPTLDL